MPSRILNCAIDLRARRICARCPAIDRQLFDRGVELPCASVFASPTPMLSVIFAIRGHLHDRLSAPSSSFRSATELLLVALLEARRVRSRTVAITCRSPDRSRRACTRGREPSCPSSCAGASRRASGACRSGRRPSRCETGSGAGLVDHAARNDLSGRPCGSSSGSARGFGAASIDVEVLDEHAAVPAGAPRGRGPACRGPCPSVTCTSVALAALSSFVPSQSTSGARRDDLHEVLLAQLAGDRPEDARAARVALVVDDHGGVLVEARSSCRRRGRTASSCARRPPARPRPSSPAPCGVAVLTVPTMMSPTRA